MPNWRLEPVRGLTTRRGHHAGVVDKQVQPVVAVLTRPRKLRTEPRSARSSCSSSTSALGTGPGRRAGPLPLALVSAGHHHGRARARELARRDESEAAVGSGDHGQPAVLVGDLRCGPLVGHRTGFKRLRAVGAGIHSTAVSIKEADEALIEQGCSRVRELLPTTAPRTSRRSSASSTAGCRPRTSLSATALDLYGLAVGQLGFARVRAPGRDEGAGLQPAVRDPRLAVHAHGRRDRDRRHAVPDRFDRHGAQPAWLRSAPGHPPGSGGPSRLGRQHGGAAPPPTADAVEDDRSIAESVIHAEVDRQTDQARSRSCRETCCA